MLGYFIDTHRLAPATSIMVFWRHHKPDLFLWYHRVEKGQLNLVWVIVDYLWKLHALTDLKISNSHIHLRSGIIVYYQGSGQDMTHSG